jgi:hypothetical protein
MRSPDALERLAAARPTLLGSLADAREEEQILAGILASRRPATRAPRRRRTRLVFAGAAFLAVAVAAASLGLRQAGRSPTFRTHRGQTEALTGARIELAGYHFRTPAGFRQSGRSCISAPVASRPRPAIDAFASAASADGGCVEATLLVPQRPNPSAFVATPAGIPVAVGAYHGYIDSAASGKSTLYVELPAGAAPPRYLVLLASGLTQNQLIGVALSGLPTLPPPGPTPTTGTETG